MSANIEFWQQRQQDLIDGLNENKETLGNDYDDIMGEAQYIMSLINQYKTPDELIAGLMVQLGKQYFERNLLEKYQEYIHDLGFVVQPPATFDMDWVVDMEVGENDVDMRCTVSRRGVICITHPTNGRKFITDLEKLADLATVNGLCDEVES